MNLLAHSLASLATISVALYAAAAENVPPAPAAVNALPANSTVRTGYAPVNGLQLYYEIHGAPRPGALPLVLLHGGGDTIATSFGELLPRLAQERQVIAFEQQGYGHTADIADRPFSFQQSAEDTAALLQHLQIERADLLGFSNGGTIALEVAMRHPGAVRRVVAITALMKRAWAYPPFWQSMQSAKPDVMPAELRDAYLRVAPQPGNLESFFYKARNRMRDFQDVPDEAMRGIAAPVLVLGSDRDVMRPEGAVELFRLLPHARLAILPDTEHMQIPTRTDLLLPMIRAFLDAP